ncbi:dATP/dGTP diphosphohydrolase domain-containing protein [Helicobacter anatolicus]|uniref:dATP/dGTP diphosphohydrolase domain-containing protein n=1 Tax=Helicobacter anatolicus TaxID=2905874 RepID=UPI001E3123FA|nr:dATP/dGTP diphosphohydrolase domain-containing protein [Helicobacter anatolicus]MCE3040281.1 DUF5664 domain-containing protein [Helicobacter anatolicus]
MNKDFEEFFKDAPTMNKEELLKNNNFSKLDHEKLKYHLLPPLALKKVVGVLTYGANKYAEENWRNSKKEDYKRMLSATYRHIEAYRSGEYFDNESKYPHLAHAICNLLFLLELEKI